MNRIEHILTIIAEECNEVAQRATKALRFGLLNIEEGQKFTNLARITQEYTDLVATLEMLEMELKNDRPKYNGRSLYLNHVHNLCEGEKQTKRDKIEKYFEISKKEGTLQEKKPTLYNSHDYFYCQPQPFTINYYIKDNG
jgi:hypothetical protein